jgi:hypothetical protein
MLGVSRPRVRCVAFLCPVCRVPVFGVSRLVIAYDSVTWRHDDGANWPHPGFEDRVTEVNGPLATAMLCDNRERMKRSVGTPRSQHKNARLRRPADLRRDR